MKNLKLLVLLITFTLVFGVFTCVSADYSQINQMVNDSNVKIQSEVQNAITEAAKVDADLNQIIAKLLEKTEKISNKMIEEAAKYNVVLEKVYNEVQIGDRVVLIDPLRVVGD